MNRVWNNIVQAFPEKHKSVFVTVVYQRHGDNDCYVTDAYYDGKNWFLSFNNSKIYGDVVSWSEK